MKKVKALILAITIGTALALSGCSEEVVLPDGSGSSGSSTQNDPDG